MSFQTIKISSDCVGSRERSATKKTISGDKFSKVGKVIIGFCSICEKNNLRFLVINRYSTGKNIE